MFNVRLLLYHKNANNNAIPAALAANTEPLILKNKNGKKQSHATKQRKIRFRTSKREDLIIF